MRLRFDLVEEAKMIDSVIFRVEYTDCLGRTRKCLRKDLEYLKSNDAALKSKVESKDVDNAEKVDNSEKNKPVEEEIKEFDDSSELLSGDMRRELQRKQWEIEEDELRDKNNIHYQDILFNGLMNYSNRIIFIFSC